MLGTLAVVSLVSFLDWLRPPEDQSHLGKFVQTVIDGGAGDVIKRKLDQNLDILFSSNLSVLVPVGVLFVVLVLLRPTSMGAPALQRAFDRSPVLRSGLLAGLIMWVDRLLAQRLRHRDPGAQRRSWPSRWSSRRASRRSVTTAERPHHDRHDRSSQPRYGVTVRR